MRSFCSARGWWWVGFAVTLLSVLCWPPSDGHADGPAATGARTAEDDAADEATFRLRDEFNEKLGLEWKIIRPDPTHVSFDKNPGKLTITTQTGSIHLNETERNARTPAKNLYVVPNPAADGGGFVLTTCIESFQPNQVSHQAGLLVYDDDDNYLKWDLEWNQDSPAGVTIVFLQETVGQSDFSATMPKANSEKFWLRLTKREDAYQYSFSTDGEKFTVAGEKSWGNGAPKRIGIYGKNGGNPDAGDVDAVFDFFEVRSLTDAEKNDPNYVERRKLRGTWEVVSCKLGGKSLTNAPLSRFDFERNSVTIVEKAKSLKTAYTLDVATEPKGIRLSALSATSKAPVGGVYSVEDDTLMICIGLDSEAPAPNELKTQKGDRRLLVKLRRRTETEEAEVKRTGLTRE